MCSFEPENPPPLMHELILHFCDCCRTYITEEEWQSLEESDNISKMEGQGTVQSPISSVVAIAITGNKNSRYVVKWALEKFIPEGETRFMLLHVRPEITAVPTPSMFLTLVHLMLKVVLQHAL